MAKHKPGKATADLLADDRRAAGKAARERVPRSTLGDWSPAADRPDPVDLLLQQAQTRVPELVPIRHARMAASAFTFYRGGAFLMATDLADSPRTDLEVQLCGDAHLSNFGIYAAPDRRLVFSINDFDETLPGPFEWDVKRLVASFAIAGRDRGFKTAERRGVAMAAATAYRDAIVEFAEMDVLQRWYARMDVEDMIGRYGDQATKKQRKNFDRIISKAESKTSLRAAGKLTHVVDGDLRFVSQPPLITPIEELVPAERADSIGSELDDIMRTYAATLRDDLQHLLRGFRRVDLARKVVGVGSVGTRAWVLLLTDHDTGDPLLLQFKEAEASVMEPFLGAAQQDNHGERVVNGQRLMQAASDLMLGWVRVAGFDGVARDYYVRQLWDNKGSARVDKMHVDSMTLYARMCGWTLARAHARSGHPVSIAAYLGSNSSFAEAMATFAELYADQNERDYATVLAAIDDGRLPATPG